MNKIEKLYDLSKKYVENLGYEMPEFEKFEKYELTDEYDELKTKCITDDDGFLIDEYDYIETIKYTIDCGISFLNDEVYTWAEYDENSEIIPNSEIKITNRFEIIISDFDFSLKIKEYGINEQNNFYEILNKKIDLYDEWNRS